MATPKIRRRKINLCIIVPRAWICSLRYIYIIIIGNDVKMLYIISVYKPIHTRALKHTYAHTMGAARHGQRGTCPRGNVQMGICNPSPEFITVFVVGLSRISGVVPTYLRVKNVPFNSTSKK